MILESRHQAGNAQWVVVGYSSCTCYAEIYYAKEGSFSEPMGLWQKYTMDIAIYGHVHGYERTCPIYYVSLTLCTLSILPNFVDIGLPSALGTKHPALSIK